MNPDYEVVTLLQMNKTFAELENKLLLKVGRLHGSIPKLFLSWLFRFQTFELKILMKGWSETISGSKSSNNCPLTTSKM